VKILLAYLIFIRTLVKSACVMSFCIKTLFRYLKSKILKDNEIMFN